jgi:hypothetical protein
LHRRPLTGSFAHDQTLVWSRLLPCPPPMLAACHRVQHTPQHAAPTAPPPPLSSSAWRFMNASTASSMSCTDGGRSLLAAGLLGVLLCRARRWVVQDVGGVVGGVHSTAPCSSRAVAGHRCTATTTTHLRVTGRSRSTRAAAGLSCWRADLAARADCWWESSMMKQAWGLEGCKRVGAVLQQIGLPGWCERLQEGGSVL